MILMTSFGAPHNVTRNYSWERQKHKWLVAHFRGLSERLGACNYLTSERLVTQFVETKPGEEGHWVTRNG